MRQRATLVCAVHQWYSIVILILTGILATRKVSGCNESLVDTVTDDKLTASSIYYDHYTADKARLSSTGWSPNEYENDSWIQVDFGQPAIIVAVETKGLVSDEYKEYVKKYRVKYSNTTSSWNTVQYGTTNEFKANSDQTTAVKNTLPQQVVSRYIRLYPTEFNGYRRLRFDVIGCKVPRTTSSTLAKPTSSASLPTTSTSRASEFTTTLYLPASTASSKPPTITSIYLQTTVITSSKPTSATTLSSQTTSITSSKPTSATTLSSQTTSITSSKPTSATTLSSQTNSITSSKPTSATTLSSQTTSITSSKLTSATALSSQTTSITSSKPTSATTLSSQTTSITPNTQTIVATTPTKSFNSTQAGLCSCTCTQTSFLITPHAVQARIDDIVQNLTVSKKKTSKYIRNKTSAQDTRPEVVYVGSVAEAILCLFASLIVLPDLFTLLRFLYSVLEHKYCKKRNVTKSEGETCLSTV